MADPAKVAALGSELVNDPLGLGYTVHNQPDWQNEVNAAADLALITTENRPVDVETLSASQLFEAIDATEWTARTAEQKDDIRLVLGLGDNIQISPGTKARNILQNALTGATNSLATLATLGSKNISRAEELELGRLRIGDIQLARREQ